MLYFEFYLKIKELDSIFLIKVFYYTKSNKFQSHKLFCLTKWF